MRVGERLRFITSTMSRTSTLVTGPPGASKPYKRDEEHLNWTWLHRKERAAMDAGIRLLVTFATVSTLIALIAVFGVWTSAGRIVTVMGRKSRTVEEPSDWFVISGVETLKKRV